MKFYIENLLSIRTFLREQGATHEQIKSVIDSARYALRQEEEYFTYYLPVGEAKQLVIYTRELSFYFGIYVRIEHYETLKFDL